MGRERRWRIRYHDEGHVRHLEQSAGVTPLVAHLLACRGLSNADDIRRFLEIRLTDLRHPSELPGVDEAVGVIFAALERGDKLCVYGDYDVDGMSATAILYSCLDLIGADVSYYIPNRLEEGYGLNNEALTELAGRGIKLVITVDCGVASVEAVEHANGLGLEVVVTDHHQFGERLPAAAAVVHPGLPGGGYPFDGLCGAGVSLKLAWALCQRSSGADKVTPRLRQFLMRALGLAALGTVADVVPLVDENRVLVRHGLKMLKQDPVPGVAELMRVTKLNQKPALGAEDIGFMLGPRLNAAGRLGYARLGAELLLTASHERAAKLAEHVDHLNKDREKLERRVMRDATAQITEHFDPAEHPALVLAGQDWHVGVVGIVAGRIAEKFNRPTILVAFDPTGMRPGTGSARTIGGINLHQVLSQCAEHLVSFGGHAAAAGIRIEQDKLNEFRESFCEAVAAENVDMQERPELAVDVEVPLALLTLSSVEQMESLAPFGHGNPRPVICTPGVTLAGPPKRMGGGDRHLSVQIEQHGKKLRAVAFGKGDWADELPPAPATIDICYRPVINEFAGRRNVEIHLIDWRESRPAAEEDAAQGSSQVGKSPLTQPGSPLS